MRGEQPPAGPVPHSFAISRLAAKWGVPPWELTGEPDTDDVRAVWVTRGLIFQDMEG